MPMQNEDRDWLDDRIAVGNYIPDDGFTARVVSRLPKVRSSAAEALRWRILFISALLAGGLLVAQMISLAHGVTYLISRDSLAGVLGQLALFLEQPRVLYGGAAGIVILGFASIPFLRRWA